MSASISHSAIQDALARAKQLAASSSNDTIKRPADDEPEETPAKRVNNGDGGLDMAGNPIASIGGGMNPNMAGIAPQDVTVEQIELLFEVPDHSVGLVIGRGGEQISQIQQISGCRVQMAPDAGGPNRPCTLQGSKASIDGGRPPPPKPGMGGGMGPPMGGGGMGGGGPGGPGGPLGQAGPGQITEELMVPGSKCGLVIGKGGETIKMIQERCGVKVVLIQENVQPGAQAKPLRIIGEPSKVAHAKQMVDEIVNSRGDGMGGGGGMGGMGGMGGGGGGGGFASPYGGGAGMQKSIGEVIVPRSSVGVIIGKGGETIRRLSMESGAKIQFKQDEDQQAPERTAVIQGTPDQIQKATQLISDLVNRSSDNANVFYMHVPANKTGLVIGRGGETIKQICAESGAHVELSRDPPPNANEKVFVIKGSDHQIHHAQHIIRIKVGDLAPGTPFGMAGGAPGGGGGYEGYGSNGGAQAWPAAAGADQNQAAWAQYYAQMGQAGQPGQAPAAAYQQPYAAPAAQPAAAAPAPAPAPAAASAPAINPQTGQPDYSAQWAEYYRNLGMHDQAAMIEAQAKQNQQAVAAQPQQASYPSGQASYGNYGGGQAGGGAPQGNGQSYPGYQQAAPQQY